MDINAQITDSSEQVAAGPWVHSAWFRIVLLTALGLGAFFRIAGLGNKIYSHDEIYTSMYAAGHRTGSVFVSLWDGKDKTVEDIQAFLRSNGEKGITDVLSLLALYSPHQAPLFFALEHYWMAIFGYTPAAMRSLAALFGCLSIPAMYWLGRELFQSPRIGLISAAIFALSPFHILFAQDARPYSLWTLITLLSSAALLRAMRKNKINAWMTYSLTLILGVYSHQLFILVALVHGFYFLGMYFTNHRKGYSGFLLACVLSILAYVPWLYFVVTRWQQAAQQVDVLNMQIPWYRFIQRWILLFSSPLIDLDLNSNTANLVPYFLRVLMLVFVAYALLFLFRSCSLREKLFIILMYLLTTGIFIVLDLLFGGMRSITGRYFVPTNIVTILVVAYFLATMLDQSQPDTALRWKFLIGVLMFSSIISNLNSLLAETWWNKELSRVRTEFAHEIDKDQTLLIVSGDHPTNLGDVLLLSLQVDSDVHFRLYRDSDEIKFSGNYRNMYWFPGSYEQLKTISEKQQLQVSEVIQGTLWRIDGMDQ
jgi:uncharacterized membrane protein